MNANQNLWVVKPTSQTRQSLLCRGEIVGGRSSNFISIQMDTDAANELANSANALAGMNPDAVKKVVSACENFIGLLSPLAGALKPNAVQLINEARAALAKLKA